MIEEESKPSYAETRKRNGRASTNGHERRLGKPMKHESNDDLKIWAKLDQATNSSDEVIRAHYLAACDARRRQENTFGGYLRSLRRRRRLSVREAAEKAKVSESTWSTWERSAEVPSQKQLAPSLDGLGLTPIERQRLSSLRASLPEGPPSPTSEGLAEYIEQNSGALGTALKGMRLRRGWSVAVAATQADISARLWKAWEGASVTPTVDALRSVLVKLSWVWDTECFLSESGEPKGPSGEDLPDAQLWRAYEHDGCWLDADDEMLQARTPEAKLAWQAVDHAVLGTNDPKMLREKLQAAQAMVIQAESTFGGFLRLRRQWSEKSVEEMADKAGVDASAWHAWEAGEVIPSVTEVEALGFQIYASSTARARMLEIRKAMEL